MKLSTTSGEGKTLIVRIAEPGELLGLHAILTGGPYELTVETMQPCQLNFVAGEDMFGFGGARGRGSPRHTASGPRLFGRLLRGAHDRIVAFCVREICEIPAGKRC